MKNFRNLKIGDKVYYQSHTVQGMFKIVAKNYNSISIDCKGTILVFDIYTGKGMETVFCIWHSKTDYCNFIKKQRIVNGLFKSFDYRKDKQSIIDNLTLKELIGVEKIVEKINSI